MVFGDLYPEDVRRYRERSLAGTGIRPLFPLWGRPTADVADELLGSGIRAVVTSVDLGQAVAEPTGRRYGTRQDDGLAGASGEVTPLCSVDRPDLGFEVGHYHVHQA